jgi:2-polyprenyl-6-methoxyphenol hydroxylase-like FAD-dependent oxidoreductase
MYEERVFIAGAGPVGLVAAARLVAEGIPVTVFEAGSDLSRESRASTFHPSTLDMLDELGAEIGLEADGLRASGLQYRCSREGLIERFDFGAIGDLTRHPYRLQCEQWRLTRLLYEKLRGGPDFEIVFTAAVEDCAPAAEGVTVTLKSGGKTMTRGARWLIGADGASSKVRGALGVAFDGFTWPDRFLVLSTPFDFPAAIPDLDPVSYVADPEQWYFLLRIPGLWRVMFPIAAGMSDDAALDPDYGQRCLDRVLPGAGPFEIAHRTLYRVHQRVAATFRAGRVMLAGDAAHINNPLGGMGMNGGIHDAVNLTGRLAGVWRKELPESELDRYGVQRRGVTLEAVQTQTIQNKRDLEAADAETRAAFRDRLHRTKADPEATRRFLKRLAMITSLERARELG